MNIEAELIPQDPAQVAADLEEYENFLQLQIVKKSARQAVLDKLGLTQDEAQALLG